MSHVSQDRLLAFAAGRADAGEAERLFGHLDACAACADRYGALQRIRADFEGSWDAFLAEWEHHAAGIRTEDGAVEAPFRGIELAVRGLLDDSRRLATAAVEQISGALSGLGGLEATLQPAYSGVADPTAGRASDLARQASVLWGEGREGDALQALRQASDLDPRTGASAELALRAGGQRVGEIIVDARRRSVSVLVEMGDRSAGAYAVLIHGSGKVPELRSPLRPVAGARYALAEFENVPTGPFTLRLLLPEVS